MSRSSEEQGGATPPPQTREGGGEGTVPIDSRTGADRRTGRDRRQREEPVARERRRGKDRRAGGDRRHPERKRSINEYALDEDARELAEAIGRFRRDHDNRFPTAAQFLRILEDLGYEKRDRS